MIAPDSGRLAVRNFSSGASAVVGILHLPPQFVPQEGASYLLWLSENGIAIEPHQVGKPLPDEYASSGINSTLTGNFWYKTNQPGTMTVRFTAAFPDENGWTVYGAANQPLFAPDSYSPTGHVWCDIQAGRVSQIKAPAPDTGMTAGQLVRDYAVWPNRQGVPHTLPDIDSNWRQAYLDYANLQARYGAGEITRDEMTGLVRADAKLFHVRSGSVDQHYCQYLARLRAAGGIEIMRPMTAEENHEKELRAARLVRQMIEEEDLLATPHLEEAEIVKPAQPRFDHPNSRWVSLLWDGLRFDRGDWVDEALSKGISPNIRDKAGVPALHVAAYLNRSRAVELLGRSGARYPKTDETYPMEQYEEFGDAEKLKNGFSPLLCAILHNNIPMYHILMKMDAPWESEDDNRKLSVWWNLDAAVQETRGREIFTEIVMTEAVTQLGWEQKSEVELNSLRRAFDGLALCLTGYESPPVFRYIDEKMPQRGDIRDPDHPTIKRIHIHLGEGGFSNKLPDGHEHIAVDIESGNDAMCYIMRARVADTALIEGDEWHSYNDGDFRSAASVNLFYCEDKAEMDRFAASRASIENVADYITAVSRNEIEEVRECLERGIDPDLALWTRYTAVDHALGSGYAQVLDAVLETSADLREYLKTLRVHNDTAQTPVAYAVCRSNDYEEFDDMAAYLIYNGYESDTADATGKTPLQYALTLSKNTPVNAIQALLETGADTSFLEEGSPNYIPSDQINPRAMQVLSVWRAKNAVGRAIAHARSGRSQNP